MLSCWCPGWTRMTLGRLRRVHSYRGCYDCRAPCSSSRRCAVTYYINQYQHPDHSSTDNLHPPKLRQVRLLPASLTFADPLSFPLSHRSILDQLIDSRAFLSFALVVVSLVSRLHALATVLLVDMVKASSVLLKLVRTNGVRTRSQTTLHHPL